MSVKKEKRMLWLSRHYLTRDQTVDLERIFGMKLTVDHCCRQVFSGEEIYWLAADYDVLGIVLPVYMINQVFEMKRAKSWNIQVIYSVSDRHETGRMILNPANGRLEKEVSFSHNRWEELLALTMQAKIL